MANWAAVVLAAGMGKRMRSRTPKVLHTLAGRLMLSYVIDALREVRPASLVVVVSPQVKAALPDLGPGIEYALQEQPLGTGHALAQARSLLESASEHVLVLNADTPLVSPLTLRTLAGHHQASRAVLTLATATVPQPQGLGRILRDSARRIVGVAEDDADLSESQRHINEINVGVYAFGADWLWPHLSLVPPARSGGEFYLTHLVGLAAQAGLPVQGIAVSHPTEALGINHRGHLAQAEAYLRQQVRERLMLAGVTLLDPPSTLVDASVEVGEDTVLYPQTMLLGHTRVGCGCRLGPGTVVEDSHIGDNCRIVASVIEGATLEEGVDVGPFSHLRPGAHLEAGVHLGNFVEVKKSRLGRGTRAGHFSYLGDAAIGAGVNIGAGTITCNFDGQAHQPTTIGAGAFIGSDTMLVAPVTVGDLAVTGAGSVVTRDIGPGEVAYGVPARVRRRRVVKA